MGRRLSDLQEKILQIAYKSHRLRPEYAVDTRMREVLIEVYGLPCDFDISKTTGPVQVFNPKRIGLKRYHAAYMGISRSFNRLVMRGLMTRGQGKSFRCGVGPGIKLTGLGLEVAEQIRRDEYGR